MKFFTVTALLAAALVSALVAVPFLPTAKTFPDLFMLEVRVTSDVAGRFQIFYDDGIGVREELSGSTQLTASPESIVHRLPIAPGTYQGIRLDPLDRAGRVTLESLQVVSTSGATVSEIPLRDLQPAQQIQSVEPHGAAGIEIVVPPNSDDPQLLFEFAAPLILSTSWVDHAGNALRIVLPLFAALAIGLFLVDRAPRFRAGFVQRCRQLSARPALAIGLTALIAVVASAYPVVFLGKSHVSPNLGTVLLYDSFPTLPGYESSEVVDVKLSDIGAVMWQHVPFSTMQHRALTNGELPLWNRYNAAGVPLLAQGQSMFGDPLHLLVIAAKGSAWAWDLKYLLAKWLFATGLGLTVLAMAGGSVTSGRIHSTASAFAAPHRSQPDLHDSQPLPPRCVHAFAAALIVALAAPFIGFFLYRINHPAFFSLCYAPWPLYCLVRIAKSTTRKSVALWIAGLLVANLALMNSGTVKEAYMLLVAVNFSGACVLLATTSSWRERLGKLAAVAWGGLLFVLLTAPIWATFLQTLKSSYTAYNAASAYQIQPTLLLGAFDEIFYRPLMAGDRVFSPSLNFLLLLGVLYFLATLRLQFANRTATALAASSLLPLALAFGLVPPHWIVTLPFLSNIAHLDNTFSCVLIVLWSVIAGVGVATAARRLGTPEGRGDLVIAGLLLGALVFGWIAFRQASHRPIFGPTFSVHPPGKILPVNPFIWDYLVSLLVAALALGVLARRALRVRRCSPGCALLITICVVALLWRHGLHASTVGFETFTARPTERVNFHARSKAMEFTRALHAREPGRGFGLHSNFFPGWTGMYGLETVHSPDALVNPWLRELVSVSGVRREWDWRLHVTPADLPVARPFLDALNVRFYFDLLTNEPALSNSLTLLKSADLDVYESPTAWPRAFFTNRIDRYSDPVEVVEKIRGANAQPFAAIQKTDERAKTAIAPFSNVPENRIHQAASDYVLNENSTSFRVRTSGPGVIVLTDAYWPGDFVADIDGRDARVFRVNHAFQAIAVDAAGDYRVTFRYWPKNLMRNLILCVSGIVLLVGSLVFALRPARTP